MAAPKNHAKAGGRKKGTPNKVTLERERVLAAEGLMPLEYMLRVLRDETASRDDRKWAANGAAPYCHPRLTTTELKGKIAIVPQEDALDALD